MFKQIKEAVFGKQTVDGVIGNFQKTLSQLNAVEVEQKAVSAKNTEQAAALVTAANEADREARRAAAVKDKISNLLNAD